METACSCQLNDQYGRPGNDTCSSKCLNPIIDKFDFQSSCADECPLECDSVAYELTEKILKVNVSSFFSDLIRANMNRPGLTNVSFEHLQKNLMIFNVNFDTLSYTNLVELPKTTLTNLVAELGGTIGVFLGLSFISFLEIVEWVGQVVWWALTRMLTRPRMARVSS
jgi:hypothetical protein